jgi:RNA polymerase-binding transcription factor DksA
MSTYATTGRARYDSGPDDDRVLSRMRDRLENFWRQQINEVTELTVRVHDLQAAVDDGGRAGKDRAAGELTDTEIRLADARRGLADSDVALQRFAKGTYGFCGHCGGTIEQERLDALPAVKLCTSCQFWSLRM